MNNEEIIRHSLSHLLAIAIKEKYPNCKLGIGPAIDNGFYYDFDNLTIEEKDLKEIEKRMKHLVKQNIPFEKKEILKEEAIKLFKDEPYKLELIEGIPGDVVSIYTTLNFIDLCAGPHVASTNEIKPDAFKLDKIAGAYWKGSEKNSMLTRIYGFAFSSKEGLDKHLIMLEEAKKRDHRVLGKELDFFHTEEDVGIGLILWHPKGALLYRIIEDFWVQKHLESGYDLVRTPHIGNRKLWERSGHWGFYGDSMYPPIEIGQSLESKRKGEEVKESEQFLLKPMNCPFHVEIYNNSPHSYRELPMRWAECGTVYRFEKKGELSGLTRVRGFTQDDAHIICRKDQVEYELKRVIDFILFIYQSFGFSLDSVNTYLSLRDPLNKEKYAGSDEGWDFSEGVLRKIAQEKNLKVVEEKGEAAFYGPKLDFKIKDALGREWQCSTLQFDFNLSQRFNMSFTNDKGEKEEPYMLHRALLGSFERFIGLLIEHYAGNFPLWLSPVQVKLIAVSEKHIDFVQELADEFRKEHIRVEVDINNETVGNKIRKAVNEKSPYMLVIGDNEINSTNLIIRDRSSTETREISKEDFFAEIKKKIEDKK
ncbi:MAG: threonine--tRNA ligase [Candidatus Pacebacteria bacterium]|nr:threonine--tRNA ligase [Candidatus Paceibacterota bacterium]